MWRRGIGGMRKKPLFRKWILSYLLVLFPLLLLCYTLAAGSTSTLMTQTMDIQKMQMSKTALELNERFSQITSVVTQLYADRDLTVLMNRDGDALEKSDRILMSRLRSAITSILSNQTSVSSVLIYLPNSDYVIDAARAMPSQSWFYYSARESGHWGLADEFQTLLNAYYNGSFINLNGDLLFARSIPYLNRGAPKANILIRLKGERIFPDASVETCRLYGPEGALLYENASLPVSITIDTGLADGEMALETVDQWMIAYTRLDSGCYLAGLTALDKINGEYRRQTVETIAGLAVCIAVCLALSVVFAIRHYDPIRKLLAMVDAEAEQGAALNEYERLQAALVKATETQVFARHAQEEESALRALATERGCNYVRARFEEIGASPELPCWVFTEIAVLDHTDDAENSPDAQGITVSIALGNLSRSLPSVALVSGARILLISRLRDGQADASMLLLALEKSLRFLRDNYAIDCRAFVSGTGGLENGWNEMARRLLEQIAFVRDGEPDEPIAQYQGEARETGGLTRLLSDARRCVQKRDFHSAQAKLIKAGSLLQELMPEAAREEDGANSSEYALKQQVIELVKVSYYDPNLNVSQIAERLGRSPDALSRAFKKTTHIGLLDYIHHMRVHVAKEMLLNRPDLTIRQISEMCGYASIDSFMRAFKRIEGMTPGKYRDGEK